jgi:hypothetical protein
MFIMLVKTFIGAPFIIKNPARYLAIMDYVRYALIGLRTDSDLVSQIYRELVG